MTNDIREYEPDTEWLSEAEPMRLTAMVGDPRTDLRVDDPEERQGHGRSVQLSIGRPGFQTFTLLTEQQTLDLMGVLSKRLACADGFSATGDVSQPLIVQPDGSKAAREADW